MWRALSQLIDFIINKLSKRETKETWNLLEMRRKANLENLEDLKKLRLKNF